jgi:hypothetical protein
MESMPILHANQIFTIFFEEDFAFSEVRAVLDHLLQEQAFSPEVQDNRIEHSVDLEVGSFQVWVRDMDVVIRRR